MGVDLEQAVYCAIPADPRDDEAPVLGNAPPATSGDQPGWRAYLAAAVLMTLIFVPLGYMSQANMPAFSVSLAGYEGIDVARPSSVACLTGVQPHAADDQDVH
jgi:hypothetical protein